MCHGYGGGPGNLNAVPVWHILDGDDSGLLKPWCYFTTLFQSGWASLTIQRSVVVVLFCTPTGLAPSRFGVIGNVINSSLDMSRHFGEI